MQLRLVLYCHILVPDSVFELFAVAIADTMSTLGANTMRNTMKYIVIPILTNLILWYYYVSLIADILFYGITMILLMRNISPRSINMPISISFHLFYLMILCNWE